MYQSSVCLHHGMAFSLHVSVHIFKDIIFFKIRSNPNLEWPHLNFLTSWKGFISKWSHIYRLFIEMFFFFWRGRIIQPSKLLKSYHFPIKLFSSLSALLFFHKMFLCVEKCYVPCSMYFFSWLPLPTILSLWKKTGFYLSLHL